MNKFKEFMLIVFAGLAFITLTAPITSIGNAGVLDTIKDTVTGHVDDIKSRFDTDREVLGKSTIVKSGSIDQTSDGLDFLHNSEGEITIEELDGKFYLVLGVDFDSSPGPDYHVYISEEPQIHNESGFNSSTQIELGKLQYGNGYQYYEIPADVDVSKIQSFLLWCKAFGAFIGSADLK